MRFPLRALVGLVAVVPLSPTAPAAPAPPAADPLNPADARVAKLTATIDRHLTAAWAAKKVRPAEAADDAEYCRRVYLDLVGRIPRVSETRAFVAETAADKRPALVNKLLGTAAFAAHFASVTRAEWLPQTNTPQTFFQGQQFEQYLQRKFGRNVPLDVIVRDLLTVKLKFTRSAIAGDNNRLFLQPEEPTVDGQALASFYQANEVKAENLAASVSRLFLGVKLECAQCHDHPFNAYSRDQFWQTAAFFGEFEKPTAGKDDGPTFPHADTIRLPIPGTARRVAATFFDGTQPDWDADRSPRRELADWVTSPRNPYFARNLANRLWAHFLGTGIVDPVDEPGDANPPSHPDLLRDLATGLADAGFDQRVLIRAITASAAYARTSRQTDPSQADPKQFARFAVRGLTSNQIFDSFLTATGQPPGDRNQRAFFNPQDPSGAAQFAAQFARGTGKPTEAETSILQALLLMNGRAVADQTSVATGTTLAAVADNPFLDSPKRVETLFLAALSRQPTADERQKFASYVDRGGPSVDRDKALADVFWVLLNSTEFLFNH